MVSCAKNEMRLVCFSTCLPLVNLLFWQLEDQTIKSLLLLVFPSCFKWLQDCIVFIQSYLNLCWSFVFEFGTLLQFIYACESSCVFFFIYICSMNFIADSNVLCELFLQQWYVQYPDEGPWYELLVIPLRFELLCSIMIPISIKVIYIQFHAVNFIIWFKLIFII